MPRKLPDPSMPSAPMRAVPALIHVADITIQVGPPIPVGETAHGLRRIVPILGGHISGPRLSGTILPAGADFQLIQADGYTTLEALFFFNV